MALVGENGRIAGGGHSPEAAHAPVEPGVFVMVRGAVSCEPLTADELRHIAQEGQDGSVPHIVASAILHCAGVENGIVDHHIFTEDAAQLSAAKNSRVPAHQRQTRQAQIEKLQRKLAEHEPRATQYAAVVGEVVEQGVAFEQEYTPGGKIDREALGDLFDRTDDIAHPAIGVLESMRRSSGTDADSRRQATLIEASRLLRYIVDEALTN